MIELRPYQRAVIDDARAAYARGARGVLLTMPTGAGKTKTAASIMDAAAGRGNRSLFLANRITLVDQTVERLREAGISGIRIIQADRDLATAPDAPITVASIDTVTADGWLDRIPPPGLIVLDEAHCAKCSKVDRILKRYPARLLGLTATPMRGDRTPLSPPFDALVVGPSVQDLIDQGHLVRSHVVVPPRGELKPGQLALEPELAYQRYGEGGLAVVFCRDVAHAVATRDAFVAAGIPAGHIDGRMSGAARRSVLDALAALEIRVLVSVDVVTEGFDFPPLAVAIMARKFGHVGRWIQAIGRVMRPAPGKTIARIIDLCGSAHDHGPPEAPREYSLDGDGIRTPTRLSFRTCVACYAMFTSADACPHCAASVPVRARALPRAAGISLVDLSPARPPAPRREWVTGPIPARFPGRCSRCAGAIRRGDPILYATLAKTTWHRSCQ
jgi:DNA repair protein RadD